MPPNPPSITGRTFGRYQVTAHLRPSRLGDFYRARNLDSGEMVAIKLLEPSLFNEPEAVRRFETEARITATLQHPCCMRLLDFGRSGEGFPYIVTELVDGEPLSEILEELSALNPERAATIAARVAYALDAAHRIGIVHRDLAPSTILVGPEDTVKVTEFGLARMTQPAGSGEEQVTAIGVRIGTPSYMAPEYIQNYELDHRADLYSLGVLLFEMLTGKPPFTGRPYKVLDMHVSTPAPLASSKAAGIPPFLDALVAKLLAKDPAARPQSAREVARELEAGFGKTWLPSASPALTPAALPNVEDDDDPVTAEPGVDPILARFIKQNTLSVARFIKVSAPDPIDCLIVERVAPVSIAGHAGVKAGMFLELPDEKVPGLRDPKLWRSVVEKRRYVFTTPDGSERIELITAGIEIGASLLRHARHIEKHYDPLDPDPSALVELWRQKAWELLERLAWRTLTRQTNASGVLGGGLFSRFLGAERPKLRNHPALLLHGAALVELGKDNEGFAETHEFATSFSAAWGPSFQSIALYYEGLQLQKQQKGPEALDRWMEAVQLESHEPILAAIEKLGGGRPRTQGWLGQTFPEYSLDTVESRRGTKLSAALAEMDNAQMVCVCLLGGFRGNAEYNDFMLRYLSYMAFFRSFVPELHVITVATERENDRPEYYRGEDLVKAAGLKTFILQDYRAFVQRAIKPTRIPTVYLLSKWGTVVHEGHLHPPELWDALERVGTERLERFRRSRKG